MLRILSLSLILNPIQTGGSQQGSTWWRLGETKMEESLDYKKACEEAIDSLEEEFENGAKAMLSFIQREATGCLGLKCNCIVCEAGKKFLRRKKK